MAPKFHRPVSESQTWSIAARTISDRIRALAAFTEARHSVICQARYLCVDRSVEDLRELGGFTDVIESCIRELPNRYRVNHGSKLLPTSVVAELRNHVPQLRFELQLWLSERLLRAA